MLPPERIIVRFSIACLVLSMFAGVLAIVFPDPSSTSVAAPMSGVTSPMSGSTSPMSGAAQLLGSSGRVVGQRVSQGITAVTERAGEGGR